MIFSKKNMLSVGILSLLAVNCTTNPMTGRKSLQLVSDQTIATNSFSQYKETLNKSKVIHNSNDAKLVKKVGEKIKNAAHAYYKSIGRESVLSTFQWEFNLIQDEQVNAWCMPGGKVAVYTGILPVTKNETGLAVVMGHEVAHALAGHGNERISQTMIAQYGGGLLGGAISNQQWSKVFQQLYPVGAQITLLKYGRNQELEADQMGLYLMGYAGYNPREATDFWKRMQSLSSSQGQPEFLSTHPNHENRISDIQKHLPKALEYYQNATKK